MQRAVGVVAFGFGEPAALNGNRKIAEAAREATELASVIFTDRDVEPYLRELSVPVLQIEPGRFPSTYRLAMLAVKEAKERGLAALLVVAARCHMWRCVRDLHWCVRDVGIDLTIIPLPLEDSAYDPTAATTYTRSAWHWWPAEIAYRILSTLFPSWYKKRSL